MVGPPNYDALRGAAMPATLRDLATSIYDRARVNPKKAGRVLSGAQRDLRRLRSRQRAWVLDAIYDLVRQERLLTLFLGTDDPVALWVGWLVRHGLAPDEASEASELDLDFQRCARWESEVTHALAQRGTVSATALLANMEPVAARQLLSAFGKDGAWDFIAASNRRAPVTLRANELRTTRSELAQRLADEDVSVRAGVWTDTALILEGRANLQALEAFKTGLFEVQDEGSQLLADLVDPTGLVVDLCAGAGGKTLALAARRPSRLVACDLREHALQQLHKRASRAGARVHVHSLGQRGALPRAVSRLRADRVLVDAPCSGSGVLRRHPEHRWLIDDARLDRYVADQGRILDRAATLVKPGGRLIYGTCSVFPCENEGVVDSFRDRHPEFTLMSASAILGDDHGDFLKTAPHTHGMDGFFGAVLVRK